MAADESQEVVCAHALTQFCDCIARRPPVYTAEHVAMRGPGERLPAWKCQCARPRYKRHTEPWDCLDQADIDAWRATSGCNAKVARHLYWLFVNFAGGGA